MNKYMVYSEMKSPPIIETERLILRKLTVSDAEDMFDYSRDPEVTRYLTWKPHKNLMYTYRYLLGIDKAYATGRFFDFAIALKKTKKMIGTCGFTSFDFEKDRVEVGYVLNPRFEGYGLMTEALTSVMEYAFNVLEAGGAIGRFMSGNEKSRKVLERCGMSFEKFLKSDLYYEDRYIDVFLYSVTKNAFFDIICQNRNL